MAEKGDASRAQETTTGLPHLDVLIVGSGVAGLTAGVRLATVQPGLGIGVLTKSDLASSATSWAQGGIAAVLGGPASAEDSTDLHLADTLAAGAGLCDVDAVRVLVEEGPVRVQELIAQGARFDLQEGGALDLVREGGHSTARVVHAGGAATGVEVERALVDAVRQTAVALFERCFALDLIVEDGECQGVVALDTEGRRIEVLADHVVLASGGAGQLFAVTTNPPEATGDGLAMALRAGVPVADVEFMQFHPTALHHLAMPRPLLSEALRGHGALLRDRDGERFVDELSSRDVVSRAMQRRMSEQGVENLWMDATGLEAFGSRFPTIARALATVGLDPTRDWLPVAPAAHYLSGGILTDLDGASALPGLWACGEVACTGVHGANRLASNSLVEGMVFGARVADAIRAGRKGPRDSGAMRGLFAKGSASAHVEGLPEWSVEEPIGCKTVDQFQPGSKATVEPVDVAKARESLQAAMTEGAGVVRSAESLRRALEVIDDLVVGAGLDRAAGPADRPAWELRNILACARALVVAALVREESRGAHSRVEFPDTDATWRLRLVHGSPR